MNLRARLSERVHIENIREILHYIQDDERLREEIYRLIYDEDSIVSYQALWVCTHFSKPEVEWLSGKQNELIDAALTCPHSGKRRMLLNLLCQQPLADPPRVDLLDFCIERMVSRQEPPGVQSNHGTRITGSRYPLCAQKYVEGNQGKEKLIILHQFLKIPLHLP